MATDPTPEDRRTARKQRRRRRTREEILDTAQAAILRDGVDKFTLGRVADEMGLTKPALYYYFKSKEAVVLELQLQEWTGAAEAVEARVRHTDNAADAVEALIRGFFAYYRDRLPMFVLAHQAPIEGFGERIGPKDLERIRPLNDRQYAGVEARARADQEAGSFPADRDPRRFAFTAHVATMGLLSMRALTAAAADPLLHSDQALLDDLVDTFRRTATGGRGAPAR